MTESDADTAVESQPQQQQPEESPTKRYPAGISLSIWPPTQRTRDAVITRLIETLASPSVLSKRYGTISQDEAESAARRIEDEAFAAATAATSGDDDGLEILHFYSKEISKRMLDTVKARPKPNVSDVDSADAPAAMSEVVVEEAPESV